MSTANSWATKAAIELIIFMGITYVAVLLVLGGTGGVNWPSAAPTSPGSTILGLNIFVGIINLIWGMVSVFFDLFTFNIPGMPAEIRMILTPLYTGMAIFCLIIFWGKIMKLIQFVMNIPAMLYNMLVLPFRPVGGSPMPYHTFADKED